MKERMDLPKRIKYDGRIYEAVNIVEDEQDDDYEYTDEEIARYEAEAEYAEKHPETVWSSQKIKKYYGLS